MKTLTVIGAAVLVAIFLLRFRIPKAMNSNEKVVFNPPTEAPENLPDDFAMDHPAAERARELFLSLHVYDEEDYRALTRRARYLLDVTGFEATVTNSGIGGYMDSGCADHYRECLEALREIGASSSYQCLLDACKFFPNGEPSTDTETRRQQMDTIREELGDFEEAVEGGPEYELYELMLGYWDGHE